MLVRRHLRHIEKAERLVKALTSLRLPAGLGSAGSTRH